VTWKENLVTEANLTLRAANPCQSADPILHREPPLLKIVAMQRAILKI
jgi:hypothetical protein